MVANVAVKTNKNPTEKVVLKNVADAVMHPD